MSRFALHLLAGCLALALLQAAIKLAVMLALIGVVVAFIMRPLETLGCIVTLTLCGLAGQHPIATLVCLCLVAAVTHAKRPPA